MVSKWLTNLPVKKIVYWGYTPLILTIDPNFQRDILVNVNEQSTFTFIPFHLKARFGHGNLQNDWYNAWKVNAILSWKPTDLYILK